MAFDITQLATSAGVVALLSGLIELIKSRGSKKEDTNTEIRKELWTEINTLRTALREMNTLIFEWQKRCLELTGERDRLQDSLDASEETIKGLVSLITDAFKCLNRIETVEQTLEKNTDDEAANGRLKEELKSIRTETARLKERATSDGYLTNPS